MNDFRELHSLAYTIVNHSLNLSKGQKVYVDVTGRSDAFVDILLKEIVARGAKPYIRCLSMSHLKTIIQSYEEEQFDWWAEREEAILKQMDAYIGVKADENIYELNDLPSSIYSQYLSRYYQRFQMTLLSLPKWLLLKMPTSSLAQFSKMGTKQYKDLFFRASLLDYGTYGKRFKVLSDRLNATNTIRIAAKGTDLQFSKKDIPSFICDGRFNLPDGEVFTAPILNSAEGTIQFNVPSVFSGVILDKVRLVFSKGKVVEASADNMDFLRALLDTDEGAKKIGEFGIGLNPFITAPTYNLAMDEKMSGSIHIALGQAFEAAYNGNESNVHCDFVLCQTKEQGGGELYFDDILVRKDGLFVDPELEGLNPQ